MISKTKRKTNEPKHSVFFIYIVEIIFFIVFIIIFIVVDFGYSNEI